MDGFFRRQNQNENQMRRTSNPDYQQPGQDASRRRRPPHAGSFESGQRRSIGGEHSMSSSGNSDAYAGYYQQQSVSAFSPGSGVPANSMGYGQSAASYGQDSRQSQGFGETYNPTAAGVMYNVPQAGQQGSVFDTTQSFSSRQSTAMQMMSADVVTAPYFSGGPTAAAAAAAMHHAASSAHGYSTNMGTMPTGSLSGAADPSTATSAHMDSQDYADANGAYASYQRTLKEVYKNIRSGSLENAAEALLRISDWFLSNVESLGLTLDDEDLYEGRVKLWQNFNNAWLALLEKQKQMMFSGKQLHHSQKLITFDDLQKIGREIIRMCDGIEQFGLVDYEYGVWEERIMSGLTECVELYSNDDSADAAEGLGIHQG